MGNTGDSLAISRRGFLKVVGTGTALVVFDARGVFEGSPLAALTDDNGVLVTELFRPDDQLHLIFEFVNLRHDVATNTLVSAGAGPSLMRVGLPRQHVAEQPIAVGATPSGVADCADRPSGGRTQSSGVRGGAAAAARPRQPARPRPPHTAHHDGRPVIPTRTPR